MLQTILCVAYLFEPFKRPAGRVQARPVVPTGLWRPEVFEVVWTLRVLLIALFLAGLAGIGYQVVGSRFKALAGIDRSFRDTRRRVLPFIS